MFFYLTFLILAYALAALATDLNIVNSLDDQLPTIARVNKPYNWTFAANTFQGSCKADLTYSTSTLPSWLRFDSPTRSFHGTPTDTEQGDAPSITVTAHGCSSEPSSRFSIYVSANPTPKLHIPIEQQFSESNPSMSSVFIVSPDSSLSSSIPTLRVPSRWSFSVGFEEDTFVSPTGRDLSYQLLQSDRSPIPGWMKFHDVTLDAVAPHPDTLPPPYRISLMLIVSDEAGYAADSAPFDIVVAPHDINVAGPLPTINVTSNAAFSFAIKSADNFAGICIDGCPIQPENITSLAIDVSRYSSWLKYNPATQTLSGEPSTKDLEQKPLLPVLITTTFNQTVNANVSLVSVPSFFTCDTLPTLTLSEDSVKFDLQPYRSNASLGHEVELTASFDPNMASSFLSFDPGSYLLNGQIPANVSYPSINVTFTAYSQLTQSTSHASLCINLQASGSKSKEYTPSAIQSAQSHRRLVLGLGISFGIFGGVSVLGLLLAAVRRCSRVHDTAIAGDSEVGRNALSEKDKQWYDWSRSERKVSLQSLRRLFTPSPVNNRPSQKSYGSLTLGRISSNSPQDGSVASPGYMRKGDFMIKLKEKVRNVSDKYYRRGPSVNRNNVVIGKPILLNNESPFNNVRTAIKAQNPFDDSRPVDVSVIRTVPAVHFTDTLVGQQSRDSLYDADVAEAVVQTASKTMSIHSTRSAASDIPPVPSMRPRLVPFTSASRVPLPQTPTSSSTSGSPQASPSTPTRVASQKARVVRVDPDDDINGDDLNIGIHYVQALGGDDQVNTAQSTLTVASSNRPSSYSSLESSRQGHGEGSNTTLCEVGIPLKIRVLLRSPSPAFTFRTGALHARLMSGAVLPKWLKVDMSNAKAHGFTEVSGIPSLRDVGILNIGIFMVSSPHTCMGHVQVEILRPRC